MAAAPMELKPPPILFFESSAQDVTVAQAALISALPKAPSYYSPYGSHVEDLKRRQEHIINRMAELNMISSNQAEAAKQEKIEFKPHRETIAAPHFVFHVKEQLDAEYGERVVELGGLKVITTLDFRLQETAEEVLREKEASLNNLGATNAALVAIDPNNGDILSMSGSIDYFNEDIDGNVNVAVRHRSPGSSFKPFVYAAAFAKGYTPETILVDAETDFGKGYTPKNYDLSQRGPVTMREALANSMNIPAVKTLYLAGIRNATDLAQKMGMTSLNDPDRYGLSLVLGGGEVRLVDEVSAYGAFATSGKHFPHRAILRVDSNDATLFDASEEKNEPEGEEVLDEQIAKLVTDILSDNAARAKVFGARSPLQLGSRPVAAKTGTTQEYRDGWTLGFTPSLVTGVWVGNNDNTPMGSRAAGVATAAPVWNAFMRKALAGTPIEQFDKPAPLKNIPHGILRGEIKEEKFKWDKDANTYYTAECPIAVGDNITVKEIHSLLFHVQRDRPLASSPANAEADPQFERWEKGIRTWIDKQNEKNKDKPEEPRYTQSMPTPQCDASSSEDLPKVKIIEPNTTIITNSPVNITVEVDSEKPIKEVRFLLDGSNIATRTKDEEYKASFSFPDNFSGRKTILVLAINEDNLIGRAHRTFIVNPDDSKPSLTLHTPKNGSNISATSFPQTVKITASDENGIDYIDVLFQKEGSNSSTRISRTSTLSPTAPNRYEVSWDDSPGTGTFYVYVIAYDKTGNFTQTEKHTVTIE